MNKQLEAVILENWAPIEFEVVHTITSKAGQLIAKIWSPDFTAQWS